MIGDPMHARALILQVPTSLRHLYLGQLWEITDILPTTERDKMGRQIRKGRQWGSSPCSGRTNG